MTITRIILTLLLAVALWACATIFARADVRILESPGGQVGPFLDLFDKVAASGERVIIDGPCMSACTLVLSVVPEERICVTRRAVLGFHAARSIDRRRPRERRCWRAAWPRCPRSSRNLRAISPPRTPAPCATTTRCTASI